MSTTFVEINSQANELYCKTKVIQKFKNESNNPLELKINVDKNKKCIFTSFNAKIGDSIEVKSKVIKNSEAERKYSDSIASGNAAIFVSNDPKNSDRIIINMGNIPPKQLVIFTSEFIQYIESSDSYEFELFRNLPIFYEKNSVFQNSEIKGTIEIKTRNEITKINRPVLSENLKILEEKYLNINKCEYFIKYEYNNLPILITNYDDDYIPSSKICFEIDYKEPICFCQKSLKENELNYIIQYKYALKEQNKEKKFSNLNPSLFIFLLDQSGSMKGHSMEVAKEALILFLQSLPAGSYYQIIGFSSGYKKYDKSPKKYTQNNIKQSIKLIETIDADQCCTDIYYPLEDIYNSKDYDKIKLPKNIFLLTDGAVDKTDDTLKIIEEHSNDFFIYAIGIGKYFDKDLIENAGILGKGNYNFCPDIKGLNQIIVKEIKNTSKLILSDIEFTSNLDEKNLYKLDNNKISIQRENQIANIKYIIEDKKEEKKDLIKYKLKYKFYNKKKKKYEEINENYEINTIEISEGNELSKLIIHEYLNKNKELNEEEITKLALKYQILTDYTSLFAEVELSDKITEEMKKETIGSEKVQSISAGKTLILRRGIEKNNRTDDVFRELSKTGLTIDEDENYKNYVKSKKKEKSGGISGFFKSVGKSIKGIFSKTNEDDNEDDNNINNDTNDDNNKKNSKEIDIKEIINEQNFVEGYWKINEITKKIKEKYKNEFKLLKELKDKNINDNIAISILIIYYINKEHAELLDELALIIEKAEYFIFSNVKDTYENIIKKIGI